MVTEVMERTPCTELIRRKALLSLNETESIWRHHVVEITLPTTDRAIAFAYPRQLGSNFELNPAAMARPSISFHDALCHHVPPCHLTFSVSTVSPPSQPYREMTSPDSIEVFQDPRKFVPGFSRHVVVAGPQHMCHELNEFRRGGIWPELFYIVCHLDFDKRT